MSFQPSNFETTLQIPAFRAALSSPQGSSKVNNTSGTEGSIACICLPASMPSISGMARSNSTKSGFSSRNFLTPDVPSSACPQTVQWELTIAETTRRVVWESSTINIRTCISSPSPVVAGSYQPRHTLFLVFRPRGNLFVPVRGQEAQNGRVGSRAMKSRGFRKRARRPEQAGPAAKTYGGGTRGTARRWRRKRRRNRAGNRRARRCG